MMFRSLLALLLIALASVEVNAQIPTPGTPPSERFAAELSRAVGLPTVTVAVDQALVRAVEAQDALESAGGVRLPYRVLGRAVLTKSVGVMTSGVHVLDLDAGALPPGRYLYRLMAGSNQTAGPFVLVD